MTQKLTPLFTVVNTVAIVILLILNLNLNHPATKFGTVASGGSDSNFYDINLDTSNGIGSGTFDINTTPVISSSTSGISGAFSTITATSSIVNGGSFNMTGGQCIQFTPLGSSTVFYLGVNTSTYSVFATSTKPTTTCS